jgi:hypothetical protein
LARRNNKSRVGATSAPTSPPPGLLDYTSPTEFVELPTKGKLYPEDHPFHLKEEVEIRYMTAKDEDILSSETLVRKGIAIDRFIENILVDSVDIGSLYAGDKNAILVAARITGYGPHYLTNITCPSCRDTSEYTFDLSEVPTKELPEDLQFTSNGTFLVDLPTTGFSAEVKLLTAKEQSYLAQFAKTKRSRNLQESSNTDLLKMIIVSVNQTDNRGEIEKFVDSMPSGDSLEVRRAYSKVNPNIDLTQNFECPSCNTSTALEVPLGARFLWPE